VSAVSHEGVLRRQRHSPVQEGPETEAVVPTGLWELWPAHPAASAHLCLGTRIDGTGKTERLAPCLPEITERRA